ncbi:MAG: hypothetical protein HZB15_07900, partial [Actinobacteria bacterium]|nr:hypothetical protein [Actinomycetota bacterium]
MTLPNWTRWLPVAPVLVGAVVVVVLVRRDEADDEPLEIHSSAVVYSSLGSLVAASDLVVVAEVTGEAPGRVISSPADPRAA